MRFVELYKSPVWYDEVVTMLMSTGHCVTLPGKIKPDPACNDYPGTDGFVPARQLKQYVEFPEHGLKWSSVIRAVQLTDAHPPLYTVAVSSWMQMAGLSVPNLRIFSVFWNCLTLVFIWLTTRRLAGRRAAFYATTFFWLNPIVLHYAVEGRSYALLLFLAAGLVWLTLRCHDGGISKGRFAAITTIAASGMMIHYFFFGFLSGCWLWWLARPGKSDRKVILAHCALTMLIPLAWYVSMIRPLLHYDWSGPGKTFLITLPIWAEFYNPARVFFWQSGIRISLSQSLLPDLLELGATLLLLPIWAVILRRCSPLPKTGALFGFLLAPLMVLGAAPPAINIVKSLTESSQSWLIATFVLLMICAIGIYFKMLLHSERVTDKSGKLVALLYVSALLTPVMPIATDILLKLSLMTQARYCLLELVPAAILIGMGCSRLTRTVQLVVPTIWLIIALATFATEIQSNQRSWVNYHEIATFIDSQDKALPVISEDHPAVTIGLARELANDRLITSWYDEDGTTISNVYSGQLSPTQVIPLINGRSGVIVVHWHAPLRHNPKVTRLESWLTSHAQLRVSHDSPGATIAVYGPQKGPVFNLTIP